MLAAACYLDPKSVGDEDTSTASGSASSSASSSDGTSDASNVDPTTMGDTAPGGDDDDGLGEALEEWEGVEFHRLLRAADGSVLTLGLDPPFDGSSVHAFELWGTETSSSTWTARYFGDFAVGTDGYLALGGWVHPDGDILASDAYLWLLGDDGDIPVHELMLTSGSAFVGEVEVGGGMLWTMTTQATNPEELHLAVLRRHGSEGAVETELALLAPSTTLAVDVDGFAYSIGASAPPLLHRFDHDGYEDWSLPAGLGVTGFQVLHARPGAPGVVVVSDVVGGVHVQELDGDGISLHEFFAPAMASPVPPAADVGDAILLAHPLPPDAYIVEARSIDGTPLWSATRSVTDASNIAVADVLAIPGGAVVIGQAVRDGTGFGFIRFVVAP